MKTKSHKHSRPVHRDDPTTQAYINLLEDIDAAQIYICDDDADAAKAIVKDSIDRFYEKVTVSGIKDLIVKVNCVGRLEVFIDYSDDYGHIRTTYTARLPVNS